MIPFCINQEKTFLFQHIWGYSHWAKQLIQFHTEFLKVFNQQMENPFTNWNPIVNNRKLTVLSNNQLA